MILRFNLNCGILLIKNMDQLFKLSYRVSRLEQSLFSFTKEEDVTGNPLNPVEERLDEAGDPLNSLSSDLLRDYARRVGSLFLTNNYRVQFGSNGPTNARITFNYPEKGYQGTLLLDLKDGTIIASFPAVGLKKPIDTTAELSEFVTSFIADLEG